MAEDEKLRPTFPFAGDVARAPVIFFDNAPSFGGLNGIALVSLSAILQIPGDVTNPQAESHLVAHLRTNAQGLIALRAAIDGALLALQPVKGQAN